MVWIMGPEPWAWRSAIIRRKEENKLRRTLARIEELKEEYQAEMLVLGLPKNMNNTLGERAGKSLEFKSMLEKRTGLPVVMWDERLTTVAANRAMMEGGVRRENRGEYVEGGSEVHQWMHRASQEAIRITMELN